MTIDALTTTRPASSIPVSLPAGSGMSLRATLDYAAFRSMILGPDAGLAGAPNDWPTQSASSDLTEIPPGADAGDAPTAPHSSASNAVTRSDPPRSRPEKAPAGAVHAETARQPSPAPASGVPAAASGSPAVPAARASAKNATAKSGDSATGLSKDGTAVTAAPAAAASALAGAAPIQPAPTLPPAPGGATPVAGPATAGADQPATGAPADRPTASPGTSDPAQAGAQTLQTAAAAPVPSILTRAAAGAPPGSVKITSAAGAATGGSGGPGSPSGALAAQDVAAPLAPNAAAGDPGAGQNGGTGAESGLPNPGGSALLLPTAAAGPAGGGHDTGAAAPASPSQTDQAAAPSGTPAPVALGLLGDLSPNQQVPITAQGAGSASEVAAIPPGMDNRTRALDPAEGGSAALTGDVASAALAAASQGAVQTEEPSAANPASPGAFSQTLATAANPAEQIKVQLSKGLKDGSDRINVLLHPEDLGTVEVKLQMQDGQVKATISADNPDTLALLKNDAHHLTQSLQNAGFNTDGNSLNFELRGGQQQNNAFAHQQSGRNNGGQSSHSGSNAGAYATDSVTDEQLHMVTAATSIADSGLDIRV